MAEDRIEPKWLAMFEEMFAGLTAVQPGEPVAILSETQSRRLAVDLSELALSRLGADVFHVVVPSPRAAAPVELRSTGTCLALAGKPHVVQALAAAKLVVDLTVEGLLHVPERKDILAGGARIFMVSNEHPQALERFGIDRALQQRCVLGAQMITAASAMHVTSAAGTDLHVDLREVQGRGSAGMADKPGMMGYWPAGLCLCFPKPHSVNGRLVMMPGDANLTFKRYFESRVVLTVEDDHVVKVEGEGLDAELMRSYFEVWGSRDAYAVSHVGWGMNPAARWDSMVMYDRRDINATEQRAFAGNFLFSTGANEVAGRYTACHFDIPMRHCSVRLDDRVVVERGVLQAPLAG
jgi:2,5-dihydroxypyridine 5,6-dioxygenase